MMFTEDYKKGWNDFIKGFVFIRQESNDWRNGWIAASLFVCRTGKHPDPM